MLLFLPLTIHLQRVGLLVSKIPNAFLQYGLRSISDKCLATLAIVIGRISKNMSCDKRPTVSKILR